MQKAEVLKKGSTAFCAASLTLLVCAGFLSYALYVGLILSPQMQITIDCNELCAKIIAKDVERAVTANLCTQRKDC